MDDKVDFLLLFNGYFSLRICKNFKIKILKYNLAEKHVLSNLQKNLFIILSYTFYTTTIEKWSQIFLIDSENIILARYGNKDKQGIF